MFILMLQLREKIKEGGRDRGGREREREREREELTLPLTTCDCLSYYLHVVSELCGATVVDSVLLVEGGGRWASGTALPMKAKECQGGGAP